MNAAKDDPRPSHWTWGALLLCVGLMAVGFSMGIRTRGLGHNRDPGPKTFPIVLGIGLIAGGCAEFAIAAVRRRRSGRSVRPVRLAIGARFRDPGFRNVFLLLLGLSIYLPSLPVLGFSLATLVFASGFMIRLGVRWWTALGVTIVLLGVVYLLFVNGFKVQLPAGLLGAPF